MENDKRTTRPSPESLAAWGKYLTAARALGEALDNAEHGDTEGLLKRHAVRDRATEMFRAGMALGHSLGFPGGEEPK